MKHLFTALLLILGAFSSTAYAAEGVSDAVVVQATGSKADFERAMKLASNMHEVLSKAQFEVVVYGPAVKLLTAFSDEAPLIQKVQGEGIKVIACGRSLQTDSVPEGELAQNVTVVPFGAVHIVNRQKQGWQYFRP
jgi:intracellular sulfur oxidation DsrE/DsrF family protein